MCLFFKEYENVLIISFIINILNETNYNSELNY